MVFKNIRINAPNEKLIDETSKDTVWGVNTEKEYHEQKAQEEK